MSLANFHNAKADELQRRLSAFSPYLVDKLGPMCDCEGNRWVSEYERDVTMMIAGHRELAKRASR